MSDPYIPISSLTFDLLTLKAIEVTDSLGCTQAKGSVDIYRSKYSHVQFTN
jgi:hypothetical protein